MSGSIRSFIAFDLDNASVLTKIANMQALLVRTGADLKTVETQNIHVTVRFLGDITPDIVEKVYEKMQQIKFAPFSVQISGLGAFPDVRYPRIVWAGITEGAEQLKSIFNQLEPMLQELGFAPESKGFNAHLTVARVRSGRNKAQLAELITKNTKYDFGVINANCLRLKKSVLTPNGPIYSTLKEHCP